MKHLKGEEITRLSFSIIRERMGRVEASEEERDIMVRIAHTTGDVDFSKTFLFLNGAVEAGIASLLSGRTVVTDVGMVLTGIRKKPLEALGCGVRCFLDDPDVIRLSESEESTRSALGMRKAASLLDGAVVAIGNAPTALFELLEMIGEGTASPALVIGVPVGFVGALESKLALSKSGAACITNIGERGGSPIAAAIVNGLAEIAVKRKNRDE